MLQTIIVLEFSILTRADKVLSKILIKFFRLFVNFKDFIGIKKVIVDMFNFESIFYKFGDNPLSTNIDDCSILETSKPYKKNESFNYQGVDYLVQNDISARSKILLIKNQKIAIGQKSKLETRDKVILDRHVSEELIQDNVLFYTRVWGVNSSIDSSIKTKIYFFDQKGRDTLTLKTESLVEPGRAIIFVTSSRNRPVVHTIIVSKDGIVTKFIDERRIGNLPWSGPNNFLDVPTQVQPFFVCNDWYWFLGVGNFLSNSGDPQTGSIKTDVWDTSVIVNYSSNLDGSTLNQQGSTLHFPGTKRKDLSFKFTSSFSSNILDTNLELTCSIPKLADLSSKRVIAYDLENLNSSLQQSTQINLGEVGSSNYSLGSGSYGAYLYDYSESLQVPTKKRVNFYGPYIISLLKPGINKVSENLKSDYSVGDSITYSYGTVDSGNFKFSGLVNQGFHAESGSFVLYRPDDINRFGNSNVYTGTAITEEVLEYEKASVLPIKSWGWIPTVDGGGWS